MLRRFAATSLLAGVASVELGACSAEGVVDSELIGRDTAELRVRAECVADRAAVPEGAWVCPETRTVECGAYAADAVETLFFIPKSGDCDGTSVVVNEGPYAAGEHFVVLTMTGGVAAVDAGAALARSGDAGRDAADDARHDAEQSTSDSALESELCTATLNVADTSAPEAVSKEVVLWPPNGLMQSIRVEDCVSVSDACDPDVDVHLQWVSSDEPAVTEGNERHEADVAALDCDSVELRSERDDEGNGRVYLIGWRAVDEAGNAVDGVCRVTVPHDRDKAAVKDPPAFRVDAPDACRLDARPPEERPAGAGAAVGSGPMGTSGGS